MSRAASEFQERDPKVVGLSPGKARDLSPVQRVLPALRPAQSPIHYVRTFFPGLKRQDHAVNLTLPPSSAEVGSEWSYTSTLPCAFLMWTRETSLFRRVCKIAKSDYWFRYVRPSARMQQFGSHWTDFHEIWCFVILRKSVEKIQIQLKPENKYG